MSKVSVLPVTQTQTRQRVDQPWLWNVVLLDDDHHTVDYVVKMAAELFGHPESKGVQIAKRVDEDGRAVLLTTHKELAELKHEQVLAFGRDKMIAGCQGSMSAIIEPAEFGGDEPSNGPAEPPKGA